MAKATKADALKRLRLQRRRAAFLVGDGHRISPRFQKWLRDTEIAVERAFGNESRHLRDFLDIQYRLPYVAESTREEQKAFNEGLELARSILQSMIDEISSDWDDDASVVDSPSSTEKGVAAQSKAQANRVFIVHGHDETMKEAVARTVTQLDLEPVILHEQPNRGRTIIEKFEDYSDVPFAVVLLSPDDRAFSDGTSPEEARPRARQNVVLELGFFLGRLGRDHVLPLYRGGRDFEMPSDYSGVIYTPFDDAGAWKMKLVQELKACGFEVDANKLV